MKIPKLSHETYLRGWSGRYHAHSLLRTSGAGNTKQNLPCPEATTDSVHRAHLELERRALGVSAALPSQPGGHSEPQGPRWAPVPISRHPDIPIPPRPLFPARSRPPPQPSQRRAPKALSDRRRRPTSAYLVAGWRRLRRYKGGHASRAWARVRV
ncbi:sterile alpha motif domain-containing protein 1-like [Manacus candei]|uniref:sterile alpha motif domain-containing protein 1-like n=1 Tax=Manacus candei TaxID=415023 RepID=UPI002227D7B8|nr:sterile alpha motif domain-containing protein 1-like [Manacus candei]